MRTLALSESSREDVISTIKDFLNPKAYYQVMHPSALHLSTLLFKGFGAQAANSHLMFT